MISTNTTGAPVAPASSNSTEYGAWHQLDQARISFFSGDLPKTAKLLENAVQAAGIYNDSRLLIEASILWRECRLRSDNSRFGRNCYDLAQAAKARNSSCVL